jgi:hypothetical protein
MTTTNIDPVIIDCTPVHFGDVLVDGTDWSVWIVGRGEYRGFNWLNFEADTEGRQGIGFSLYANTWTLEELKQAIREG